MDTNNDNGGGTKRTHDGEDDVEDIGTKRQRKGGQTTLPLVTTHTISSSQVSSNMRSWREILGPLPSRGNTRVS